MLEKFGGHSQAAGMTIRNDRLDMFYERFNALVEEKLQGVVTEPELLIDCRLRPEHIVPKLFSDTMLFAPFGEGNTEPVFALEDMIIESVRFVGNGEKHLKFVLASPDGSRRFDAIGFSLGEAFPDLKEGERLDVAFTLNENTWNGHTSLQLKLVDIRRKT